MSSGDGLPPLYVISDAERVGQDRFVEAVERGRAGGLRMVLLREPGWPPEKIALLVERLHTAIGNDALILVSVHPEEEGELREGLARDLHLGGIHLGRAAVDEIPRARLRMGSRAILGYSAHAPAEARDALAAGADYVSLSPIFAPLSKPTRLRLLGLGALEEACAGGCGPIYALGGITTERAARARAAGAAGVAAVGAVLDAEDPRAVCEDLSALWRDRISPKARRSPPSSPPR